MLIRVRSKAGVWRQETQGNEKLSGFIAKLEHEKGIKILNISLTQSMDKSIQDMPQKSLAELGLKHGDFLFIDAVANNKSSKEPAELLSTSVSKTIDSHGNLVASKKQSPTAFRPGLQSLRSQKLHWTLTDFVEYDSKFTFEIKGELLSFCSSTSLDASSCNSFQSYLQNFNFQTFRCGYLYGKYVPGEEIEGSVEYERARKNPKKADDSSRNKPKRYGETKAKMRLGDLNMAEEIAPKSGVIVHAIYEPLQESLADSFQLLEDPREEVADLVARNLGWERVGVVFSHPPGREDYHFSTKEILFAGEQALESTQGKFDSPFVVVKVTSDEGNASFDAFSLTPQCLEMVAEEALIPMPETPGHSAINTVFTLIVEKKESDVVDNDFFIKRVPILSHQTPMTCSFPKYNRPLQQPPSTNSLKAVLSKVGRNASKEQLAKALADFNLLIYLADLFDTKPGEGFEAICKFVASHVNKEPIKALADGYSLILYAAAGMD